MKFKGKDFLLEIKDGDEWLTCLSDRSTSFSVNNEQVDSTAKQASWRELIGAGIRSSGVACQGVVTDRQSYKLLMAAVLSGEPQTIRIIHGPTQEVVLADSDYRVTTLERGGEYNNAETYNFTLESAGVLNVTEPLSVYFDVSTPSGIVPLFVSFTSHVSGGVPPYTYAWDFGDGGTSTDENPSHMYESDGLFEVQLTVTDSAANTAHASTNINVFVDQYMLGTLSGTPSDHGMGDQSTVWSNLDSNTQFSRSGSNDISDMLSTIRWDPDVSEWYAFSASWYVASQSPLVYGLVNRSATTGMSNPPTDAIRHPESSGPYVYAAGSGVDGVPQQALMSDPTSWSDISSGLPKCVGFVRSPSGRVWATTTGEDSTSLSGAQWRYTDNGDTWVVPDISFRVQAFPGSSSWVSFSPDGTALFSRTYDGVGILLTQGNQDDGEFDWANLDPILTTSVIPARSVYFNGAWLLSYEDGGYRHIMRTENLGSPWTEVFSAPIPDSPLSVTPVHDFAITPSGVFCASANAISSDGITWAASESLDPFTYTNVYGKTAFSQ